MNDSPLSTIPSGFKVSDHQRYFPNVRVIEVIAPGGFRAHVSQPYRVDGTRRLGLRDYNTQAILFLLAQALLDGHSWQGSKP